MLKLTSCDKSSALYPEKFFLSTQSRNFKDDPFAEREASKYANPLPSREFILDVLSQKGELLTMPDLIAHFELVSEEDIEGFSRRLRAMERDGQLIQNRRGVYGIVKKMDLVCGRIVGHADGFGFLIPDDGSDDLFISARRMRGVLHGDRALARLSGLDQRGRREGAPVEVLERANHQVVGRYQCEHGIAFVVPSNKRLAQDFLVPDEHRGGAVHGQIVVAEIIEQPTFRTQPIVRISEVLGDHMAPGMEIDIAARAYELPNTWPDEVLKDIANLSHEVPEEAKVGREDLRNTPLVTIDGEDARDFDDAVFCEPKGNGWRLLVAIADVSHYVAPNTALDQEAHNRGNSVYFPGHVIPMLPEILSNGLCSINPKVDRLCMVCEMQVSRTGNVGEYRFFEGVMRSAARLTYNEVAAMVVDNDADMRQRYADVVPHLDELYQLYKAFDLRRIKRGVIEFGSTETRILFDENRKINRIVPVVRNDAHKMIEEFMIAANVSAAHYLEHYEMPTLYRVHGGPTPEKLTDVRAFLAELGVKLEGGKEPGPEHYAKLLRSIKGRADATLIETVLLRSLSQAVYSPENEGHFGLAFGAYAHFTSPIRRYPDLLVHRGIRHILSDTSRKFAYTTEDMEGQGIHCSVTERRADDATREAVDWLKCEFMQDKVGQEFNGIVTSVTSFGIFVQLKEVYVEGLVHITALGNDYYHFDAAKHRLTGERSSKTFHLADPVRVRVVRVSLDDKKIDFELVVTEAEAPRVPKEPRKPRRRR